MIGNMHTAQRIVNAQAAFVQTIMERGLTKPEAERALETMLRLKVAKVDAVGGRVLVSHGIYMEADVLRNAAALGAA